MDPDLRSGGALRFAHRDLTLNIPPCLVLSESFIRRTGFIRPQARTTAGLLVRSNPSVAQGPILGREWSRRYRSSTGPQAAASNREAVRRAPRTVSARRRYTPSGRK